MTRLVAVLFVLALALSVGLRAQASPATGFEGLPTGELRDVSTALGRFRASAGHAVVDDQHHRSGAQCLHILGGDSRTVLIELRLEGHRPAGLRFWAERWTRRDPFEFRVEVQRDGAWREAYRGDSEIVIGGFRTEVRVPLGGDDRRLRVSCSSPSGILIDDMRVELAEPMRVVSATTRQEIVPCLLGNPRNVIARVEVSTLGALEPLAVCEVRLDLSGCSDLSDLASVQILTGEGLPASEAVAPSMELSIACRVGLASGTNEFSVSVVLASDANLDHFVDVACLELGFEDGTLLVPQVTDPEGHQRIGVALRRAGDDGVRGYRIPGLVTTNAGSLIAVYDARWRGMGDLPGDVDVGMSRSEDGGRSWEPMAIVMDMGRDEAHAFDGIGDPSILVDRETGTIWIAATWSHGNRAWRGSGPGLTPEETGQLMLVRSDDDGMSWSEPINITSQVKQPEWCYLLQGPGRGIQMRDGTLVFPAQFQASEEDGRVPSSTILYSVDHGESWRLGQGARLNTTEAQVVETEPGVLMLNMRDNRGGSRAVCTTSDLGVTWSEHPTSRRSLIEPVCNAALIRASERELLFVNPAVPRGPRRRMTVRWSPDLGETWPEGHELLLDAGVSAGYPSATMIDEDWVGVLFEGSSALLAFVRVPMAEIRN
ncbi:MAG: exo-alpha-sialidase [Planctomycetota bacterium]